MDNQNASTSLDLDQELVQVANSLLHARDGHHGPRTARIPMKDRARSPFTIYVREADLELFHELAQREGLSLSRWGKRLLAKALLDIVNRNGHQTTTDLPALITNKE